MARSTRTTLAKPAPRGRPPAKPAIKAAAATPKLSKDELRAQLEKLARANATLRAKSREATRVAKAATARVAELEERAAELERKVASQPVPPKRGRPPAAAPQPAPFSKPEPEPLPARPSRRKRREVVATEALPDEGTVADPQPLDEEAQAARDNLEHLD